MPRTLKHDQEVAAEIRKAIQRIDDNEPDDEGLRKRAARGTLKLSPTTVSVEAKVDRHLIGGPKCLYAAEYDVIVSLMPKKGEAVPLRKQLDDARKRLADTTAALEKVRTVCAQVLVRMHKQDLEIQRLNEEIANRDEEEAPLIGTGRVSSLPTRQTRTDTKRSR